MMHLVKCFMGVFLISIFSVAMASNYAYAHYGDQLSGYGTARIDGVRSIGEWDGAQVISVFGGKSDSSLLLVMNDEKNLYLGLYVVDNVLTPTDEFGVEFDNSHNGIIDINDDSGGLSGDGNVFDGYFNGTNWNLDQKFEGEGAAQHEGSRTFFEYSKPLSSGNDDDINLSIGDVVGFCVTYFKNGMTTDSSQYGPDCRSLANDQKFYGDILLVPFSVVWHGQMAMDADKRNVDFGDLINYDGYLYGARLIEDTYVTVTIYEQDTGKTIMKQKLIPNPKSMDYFGNTAWPFSFKVDTSKNEFKDGMTYVVEANYNGKSTNLNFLIKPDTKTDLTGKATDAKDALVDAGTKTGELAVEAGKEAGKAIVGAGGEVAEKGLVVGDVVSEKGKEAGQVLVEKGTEGIQEIQEKGGGCLIATAAYGTELSPQVQFLREIRDNKLMSSSSGSEFMHVFNQFYYSFSPTIADYERENPIFQQTVRLFITPMISTLPVMNLAEEGNESQMVGLGLSVISLNITMYFVGPAIIGYKVKRKLSKK